MKKFYKFKSIRGKILFAFSIVILMVVVLNTYNHLIINKLNEDISKIVEEDLKRLVANKGLETTLSNRFSVARAYLLTGESEYKERFDDYTEQGKEYEQLARSVGVSQEFEELMAQTVAWRTAIYDDVFAVYEIAATQNWQRKI